MNEATYVLDSFALLALFQQEQGWERVRELISEASNSRVSLHMSIINAAEVQYTLLRRGKLTPQINAAIGSLPILIASADDCVEQVVTLKSRYAVSLADCFGAALAIKFDCPIITADPEFRKLEEIVRVEWLR